jgi:hypothetical protein
MGSNKFYIVGRKSDAEVAEWAIVKLIRAADQIATKEYSAFYRKCIAQDGTPHRARGYRDAFLLGFINRLKERYDAKKAGDKTTSSVALVRIDRERKAVKDFMAEQRKAGETKALTSRKKWSLNEPGRRRGREVADGVNLGEKAVKAGGSQGQLS